MKYETNDKKYAIINLSEKEFLNYSKKSPYTSFYQMPEWAKVKKTNGWNSYFVGLKDKNKIYVYKKSKTLPKFVVLYLAKAVHTKTIGVILCDILACFGG